MAAIKKSSEVLCILLLLLLLLNVENDLPHDVTWLCTCVSSRARLLTRIAAYWQVCFLEPRRRHPNARAQGEKREDMTFDWSQQGLQETRNQPR